MQLKRGCKGIWLVLPLIALDRILKQLVIHFLAPRGVQTAIPGVLSWAYAENRGAAFSMLSGRNILLIALSVVLVAALVVYLLCKPDMNKGMRCGLWMIIAGGIGNLYDRIIFGYVVDFIRLDFINFAIFNPADVFICLGAGIAALSMLLTDMKGKKNHG